jgi:putative isomerase
VNVDLQSGRAPVFASPEARREATDRILAHIHAVAPKLCRPPKGCLPHPSLALSAPGERYSEAMWDWDVMWTAQGLIKCAHLTNDRPLLDKVVEHTIGTWLNFFSAQSPEGRVPLMIAEADPDPFRCVEPAPSPNHRNQAKPVFGLMAKLACDETGDVSWLAPHFDKLLAFYDSWLRENKSQVGLLVWGDDVAIGFDNDPATCGRPFFSSAHLLLNTLYYEDLLASAELARRLGRSADAEVLAARAVQQAADIREHCWDPRDRFFYTVDVQCVDMREQLIKFPRGMDMSWKCLPLKVQTYTGFLPLWCRVATQEQADALVRANWIADDRFRAEHGCRSTSNLEKMYSLIFSSNPSNWLGPVWTMCNWFTWKALANYGFEAEAADLADRNLRLLANGLAAEGGFNEYYNPDTGEGTGWAGYGVWNLLALDMI